MTTKSAGAKSLALLAGTTLVLTACATSNTGGSTASSSASGGGASASASSGGGDKTFTWAYEQEMSSYNGNTAEQNASANAVIANAILGGFWMFKPDGTLEARTDFGTYEKTSDSPLTVKYTISDKAVWSDGEPITCDDMALTWLANSGKTGEKGFSSASTAGYQDHALKCDSDKQATATYKTPFADWAALYGVGAILPAHILEKQAGLTKKVTDYMATPTSADLAKAITFYNTGWDANPGELKKDIMLSSGPYTLDAWSAGQSLTLKANPKYYGTPASIGTVVIKYLGGPAQAQALQNGEVNAMDPQPQVDLVNQIKALGDKVKYSNHDQYTFEHFDFNFKGSLKDKNLREAWAKCLPRQQMIDNLIKPVNPDSKIMQSRFIFPFQAAYADFENGVGGDKYNTVDIAGAKALLKGATPTVRIGWRKDPAALNKRRADAVALVQASCSQAGFKVVDAGTPTFFSKEWPGGQWDVAMFAWAGSPLVTGSTDIYLTGGGQNPGKYSNPEVDKLLKQLNAELDTTKQTAIQKQIDTILWTDLATIPAYAFPAMLATTPNATGMEFNATQADLSWNVAKWGLS